jgi:exonuclease SbcC
MSLMSWFSKPAWQSRDSAKRADGVAHGRDAALIAELPQIVRNDADARVRRAALERIDDLTVVADRMSNDADAGIRERAKTRLVELLAGNAPLAERRRALGLVEDVALLEQIARRAPETELRRAALERCKRPGFIAERVLEDADPELRLELLARVEQPATLERLAQQARTRDKRLARAIRERLDAGKLEAGAADALLARAEALCASLEQQLKQPSASAAQLIADVEREWTALRPRIDERFDRRFDGAVETLRAALGAIARIGEEPAPVPADEVTIEVPVVVAEAPVPVAPPSEEPDSALADLLQRAEALTDDAPVADIDALERRWDSQWARQSPRCGADQAQAERFAACLHARRAGAEARAQAHEAVKSAAEAAIAAADTAIEAGQLIAARAARAQARAAVEALPESLARGFARKLAALDPRIDKLAQWQRWSDNKVRVRLCEEVEALIGSGMHPDGLANKIAELKAQWKRIDDSEADPAAPAAESGLAKRFRFLCHKALEPARGYFEKRKEVRGKRSEELGAFIERARGVLDSGSADVPALITLKREAGDCLRRVDEVDPRQRGEIGKQLKQLMENCSTTIDARFAGVAEEKQKLIAQLRRQLTHAELDAALDLAKNAQKRWQTLGKGSAKTDQALWQEFRALIDPLFAKRNDELKAADAALDAERAAAVALVDEMRALADSEVDASHIDAEIARIEQSWRGENRPRDLERALDDAVAKAHAAADRRRSAEVAAKAGRVADLALQLDAIEARWLAGEPADGELEPVEAAARGFDAASAQAFLTRIERLGRAQAATSAALLAEQAALGERLALEYEYLCGSESPADAQSALLNLQVEKLAARMASGQSASPAAERAALDLRWWALGPLAESDRQRLTLRRAKALGKA